MTEEEFGAAYAAGVEQVRRDDVMRAMADVVNEACQIFGALTGAQEPLQRARAARAAYRQLTEGR